jgi:O-methyltransferase
VGVRTQLAKLVHSNRYAEKAYQIWSILTGNNYGFMKSPSYSDDGLITFHVCRFMQDPLFQRAYTKGANTGALRTHPGNIHWRTYVACWAAQRAMRLKGDFVECGVSLGLLSRAVVEYVNFGAATDKRFFLFDTYSGIPEDRLTQEEKSRGIENRVYGYSDCYEQVCATFSGFKNVNVIRGRVPESLASCDVSAVAYLSIDMNNASSEIAAAEYYWDKLVSGAAILLDDYAYSEQYSAQHDAFDEFSKRHGVSVMALPTGQGLIFKP